MLAAFLCFFVTFPLLAQVPPQVKVIPNPENISDFDHPNKGCPENSECDPVMGLQLQRWQDLISKLKDEGVSQEKKAQFVELFRSKYGLPVEFYTYQKSQLGFKPLLYNSPCKDHNPKEKDKRVWRGISFLKSLSKEKAVVWRDQVQIEVPTAGMIIPQSVQLEAETFYLPLMDQPLYIKDKALHVLKEDDGFFYLLKISSNGDWKVVSIDYPRLSYWEDKRQEVKCPVEKGKTPNLFGVEFCKLVWDEDLKKSVTVKLHQGCII